MKVSTGFMPKPSVRTLVMVALFVALHVVVGRLSLTTDIIRISWGFLVIAMMGWWFGPFWAGIGAGMSDIIASFMFGTYGYFPGYTLSAILGGVIYGLLFYHHKITLKRTIIAVVLVMLIVNCFFNTWWLAILGGKSMLYYLPLRLPKELVMMPIQIILIYLMGQLPILTQLKNRLDR